jgi:hypothetical protein
VAILATEHQIDLLLGQNEVLDEIWQQDHGERLHELRLRVAAVVHGAYEERWQQVRRPWPSRKTTTQLLGRFHTEAGDREFTHQGSEPAGLELLRQYEPY